MRLSVYWHLCVQDKIHKIISKYKPMLATLVLQRIKVFRRLFAVVLVCKQAGIFVVKQGRLMGSNYSPIGWLVGDNPGYSVIPIKCTLLSKDAWLNIFQQKSLYCPKYNQILKYNLDNYFNFHVCLSFHISSMCSCDCPKTRFNFCYHITKCQ